MADELSHATDLASAPEGHREIRKEWPAWLILAGSWFFSLWAMGRLPSHVPTHWNLRGEIDGWGSPLMAALLLPAIATGAYLIILAYDWGRMDIKAARAMAPKTTRQIRMLVVLLLAGMHGLILWTTLRGGTLRSSGLMLLLALFFVCLGNLMPRLEPNAWVGIRIPPTLENREVWKRTHRMAGRWLMMAGLLGVPLSLLPEPIANLLLLPIIVLPLLLATVYAYRLRHRLDHDGTHLPEPQ
jgi:uncharacterized membrane protein